MTFDVEYHGICFVGRTAIIMSWHQVTVMKFMIVGQRHVSRHAIYSTIEVLSSSTSTQTRPGGMTCRCHRTIDPSMSARAKYHILEVMTTVNLNLWTMQHSKISVCFQKLHKHKLRGIWVDSNFCVLNYTSNDCIRDINHVFSFALTTDGLYCFFM